MTPLFIVLAVALAPSDNTMKPIDLRCEYRRAPLGIDVPNPRLSFVYAPAEKAKGLKQSAYHILVASTPELLAQDKGDLWDSGKVESDAMAQIRYVGKALSTAQRVVWKVRTWDQDGKAGPWSDSSSWGMGLLGEKAIKGSWIGFENKPEADPEEDRLAGLEGLAWHGAGDPTQAPKGKFGFRKTFDVAEDSEAFFYLTADDGFRVFLDGTFQAIGDSHKIVSRVSLGALQKGSHTVAVEVVNYDAGPSGLAGVVALVSKSGTVKVPVDDTWKAKAKPEGDWTESGFDDKAWRKATPGPKVGERPWGGVSPVPFHKIGPPALVRKGFILDKPVKTATAFVSALGTYRVEINGRRVNGDELMPGYVNFNKRVYFLAYDVTPMVREGLNAIGATVAEGWFGGYLCFTGRDRFFGGTPRFFAQIEVEYADGTKDTIVTDKSWVANTGPVRYADLLQGAKVDTRIDLGPWTRWGYDDAGWKPVQTFDPVPDRIFRNHPGEPIRRLEEITAISCWQTAPGVWTFDLGQNMVGWARLKVDGPAGQTVRFRHAEMLNPDQTVYTTNLRAARAIDEFILAGGPQVLEPSDTFHGFQFVEVSGLTRAPRPSDLTGIVLNSDLPTTGEFACSNGLLNQLVHNILWGQKGNYLDVPTDCPQRDERAGWTGDAQFYMGTAAYMMDVSAFFAKWLEDLITDGQDAEGAFPDIAPTLNLGHGNVAWGDAALVCTDRIWEVYGDRDVLAQYLPAFEKYAAYMAERSDDGVRGYGAYGDWLNLGGGAKAEVIGTAYHAQMLRLISKMHAALGQADKAKEWGAKADHVKGRFIESFVGDDGTILESSQTGYALAFAFDLLPEAVKPKAAAKFKQSVAEKDWKLATGFIGTPILLPALKKAGLMDVAAKLLLQEGYPSWLFPVINGATTIWERWDGWRPDAGFQTPDMNSFNHYAFGSVGQFLFEGVAGIQPLAPGFRKVRIEPGPVQGLSWAEASYNSISGTIQAGWRKKGRNLELVVFVPTNVEAEVVLPGAVAHSTLDGKPISETAWCRVSGPNTVVLGSGRYRLRSPL